MSGREVRETIGVIVVVASLGFVGFEIRQNTAAVESTAFQSLNELTIQTNLELLNDPGPELLLRLRGGALPVDFTPEEDQRVRMVYFAFIDILNAAYHQVRVGVLAEDVYPMFWPGLLSFDYIREAWPSMAYSYDPEFADFFGGMLESMPRSPSPSATGG